jgi:hypothetical protein
MGKDAASQIAALIKRADLQGLDQMSGALNNVEQLRRAAVARNRFLRQGAEAGGSRTGGTLGAAAGAGGGVLAARPLSRGLNVRGRLGVGGLLSALGALGLGSAGADFGRSRGGAAVPDLPDTMNNPVTPESLGDVASHLAKAASDPGLIARMMEKQAILGRFLGGVGQMATKAMPGLNRAFSRPMAAGGGRAFSGGRLARTAGGVGAGAAGLQHMQNNADNTQGMNLNPLTWTRGSVGRSVGFGGGPSAEDIYRRNMTAQRGMTGDLQKQIDASLAGGKFDEWKDLNSRLQSGNYGGSFLRMGGLNPWAESHASHYQGNALEAQKGLQNQYDETMGASGPQSGDAEMMSAISQRLKSSDLLPDQASALQKQMQTLQGRLSGGGGVETPQAAEIRKRMEGAGMRFAPAKPPGAAVQPYAGFSLGSRPAGGGLSNGSVYLPGDYRPRGYWEAVMNQGQGQAG